MAQPYINQLNPIQTSPEFKTGANPRVLVLGGWDQNPDLMGNFQIALEDEGYSSVAWSPFDVVDPVAEFTRNSLEGSGLSETTIDDLLEHFPPRMVERASLLLNMSGHVLEEVFDKSPALNGASANTRWPFSAVTHCAGANVLLLALYINRLKAEPTPLPRHALLVEPMIASGRTLRDVTLPLARHEKSASIDPRFISLKGLRHPEAVDLGTAAKQPLTDILNAQSTMLLRQGRYVNAKIIVGESDVAAPDELIIEQLGNTGIPILHYPEQQRFGHGYMLAEPRPAAKFIAEQLVIGNGS